MSGDDIRKLSIDRYPDPACSYTLEGSRPVIRAHNDRFESVSNLRAGDDLADLFESEFSPDDGPPGFEETARVWIGNGAERDFLVRVIPPDGDEPGHLLFQNEAERDDSEGFGVDRVASVISHDLRNPLDVARARLRAGRELDSEEHFDHVEQAHDRMERIIQDVLTLARGEDVVNPEEYVDLGELAEEAWQTVETNGATLDVEAELPTALADYDRVSRLFENLFRNSVEHGPAGSGPESRQDGSPGNRAPADETVEGGNDSPNGTTGDPVTITVGRLDEGFYIADDGIGIPEGEREQIFEPGYTSDDHGTGLGLAIVARIADLHGWSVEVRESADGGARFDVTGLETE